MQPGLELRVRSLRGIRSVRGVFDTGRALAETTIAVVSRQLDRSRLLRDGVFILGVLSLIALAWFGS